MAAAGQCITAQSRSASSIIAAIACANSRRPVDLWITLTSYPQPHRPNNHSNRVERNRKTVTHVAGCSYCCSPTNDFESLLSVRQSAGGIAAAIEVAQRERRSKQLESDPKAYVRLII